MAAVIGQPAGNQVKRRTAHLSSVRAEAQAADMDMHCTLALSAQEFTQAVRMRGRGAVSFHLLSSWTYALICFLKPK